MRARRGYALLIPTYDNPKTIGGVVLQARAHFEEVIVVDDGSADAGRRACQQLAEAGLAHVLRLPHNQGKGAAIKEGMRRARELGMTHVFQVDGDGQHDLARIQSFLDASEREPAALILGYPEYDETVPAARLRGHSIHHFWLEVGIGKGRVKNGMIGFRVYPLGPLSEIEVRRNRMEYDAEVVVRAAWAEVPIINLPVGVRYLQPSEGGISHFRPVYDVVQLVLMHTGFVLWRWFTRALRLRPAPRACLDTPQPARSPEVAFTPGVSSEVRG